MIAIVLLTDRNVCNWCARLPYGIMDDGAISIFAVNEIVQLNERWVDRADGAALVSECHAHNTQHNTTMTLLRWSGVMKKKRRERRRHK